MALHSPTPATWMGLRLGTTLLDASGESAYQRSLLELSISASRTGSSQFPAEVEAIEVLSPSAGRFVDAGVVVFDYGLGDGFDLNAFPNLSAEGQDATLGSPARLTLSAGSRGSRVPVSACCGFSRLTPPSRPCSISPRPEHGLLCSSAPAAQTRFEPSYQLEQGVTTAL